VIPPDKKIRVVLAVLAGAVSASEAARKEKVSEQSIHRWKADFVEAGKVGLAAGRTGRSTRELQLEAEVAELTQALGEAHLEARVWKKKSAEGRLGPSKTSREPGSRRGCRPRGSARWRPGADLPALAGQGETQPAREGSVAAAGEELSS
jgi:transposase